MDMNPQPPSPDSEPPPVPCPGAESVGERALRAVESLFHAVVDGSADGIMILTREGIITFANPAAGKLLGRSPDGLTGQPFGIPLLRGTGPSPDRATTEIHSRAADGSVRTVELHQADAEWQGIPAYLVTLRDVTDFKDQVRKRDEFLAMLSHELRNPLAAIRAAHEFMKRSGYDPAAARRGEAVIDRQFEHTTRLLDDLLNVSRITQGKIELRMKPLELAKIIREGAEAFRPAAQQQALRLCVRILAESLPVEGDEVRLQQILANLFDNAGKCTEAGGTVEVTGDREGVHAVVRVRDTGMGIPPTLLRTAFDPFVQGEQPLDRGNGGLGIGLTLVRQLVEMHGGTVAAHSDGPGQGSCFTLRLPLARREAASSPNPPPRQPGQSLRIVLVEDHEDARMILQQLLESDGHQVVPAADGLAGLDLIREHRPDAAVIDIGLPGLDGYELAGKIRGCPEGQGILLIALTGYNRPEDRKRALEVGFDVHLAKPLEYDRLLRALPPATRSPCPTCGRAAAPCPLTP